MITNGAIYQTVLIGSENYTTKEIVTPVTIDMYE